MSNTNVPARKAGKTELVEPGGAAAALDAMILALPNLEEDELTERTLSRIMNATEAIDIFANPELEGFFDLLGRPLVLRDVLGHLPSRFAEAQRYLVYDVVDEGSGERLSVASGSPYIAASALVAKARGLLPAYVRAVALDSTSKPGQQSLWLIFRQPGAIAPSSDGKTGWWARSAVKDQVKYPYLQNAEQ
jgi:hypothetical protein